MSITNLELAKLGLKKESLQMCETVDELKDHPHAIIVAKANIDCSYNQNNFQKTQSFKKNNNYVMSIGMYAQMREDKQSKIKILSPSTFNFDKIYRQYNGNDLTNKKLLIWRQGGIGDLLFIKPNLDYLKEKYPTCKITFACGPQYQSMVRNWSCVDDVIDLPFHVNKLFEHDYHCIFEGVIERTKEAETVNCYRLFTNWMGLYLPDSMLHPVQIPNEENINKCKDILNNWKVNEKEFVLIQMRASSIKRTPRPKKWKDIINKLTENNLNVILTDSPHQAGIIDTFITSITNYDKVFNFSKYSDVIQDSIAMASLAGTIVGVDSSLVHIGESVGVPTVGIFGAFSGEIRLSTYKQSTWFNCKSNCAPCFQHGQELCPYSWNGYPVCYDTLDVDEVVKTIIEKMRN